MAGGLTSAIFFILALSIVRTSPNTEFGCPCKHQVLPQREPSETGGSGTLKRERTMKSDLSRIEERQFITKEFADTIAGKTPPAYFRLHNPVQNAVIEFAASDSRGLRSTANRSQNPTKAA